MTYQDILKIIPSVSATRLLSDNIGYSKKKKRKNIMGQAVSNVIGTGLIKSQAELI